MSPVALGRDYTCLTLFCPFDLMPRKLMLFTASSDLLVFSVKLTFYTDETLGSLNEKLGKSSLDCY